MKAMNSNESRMPGIATDALLATVEKVRILSDRFKLLENMKTIVLAGLLLLTGILPAWAQESGIRYIQAAAPLDIMALRSIDEVIRDLDPNAKYLHHFDDKSILQLEINHSVSDAELRSAITNAGVLLLPNTPVIEKQQPVYTTSDGKPLYVLTGDEAADRARYVQAVEEWNAQNPQDQLAMPLPAVDHDQ